MPLRIYGPIVEVAAARGGIAAKFPRNRRRCPFQPPANLAHAVALRL
jgi:hypothetical protein